MSATSPVLSYSQHQRRTPRFLSYYALYTGFLFALCVVTLFEILFFLPRFFANFRASNIHLPPFLDLIFSFCNWCGHGGWLLVLGLAFVLPLPLAALTARVEPQPRRHQRAITIALLFLLVDLFAHLAVTVIIWYTLSAIS
jgi:type II secretory pathway component PulF